MRTLHKLALTTLACLCFAGSALALGPVELGVSADYASRYIWRGYDIFGDGDSFQSSASASFAPIEPLTLTGGVWAAYDMDRGKEWAEVDWTFDASYTVNDRISVSAGWIFYHFPTVGDSDANDTAEVYAGVGLSLPMGFSAGVTGYYDYDDGEGYYINTGIGYEYGLSETAAVSVGANFGYMTYDDDSELYAGFDGVSDVNLSVGFSADLGYGLGMGITATYTIVPDDEINEDNEFWTLSSLSYSF